MAPTESKECAPKASHTRLRRSQRGQNFDVVLHSVSSWVICSFESAKLELVVLEVNEPAWHSTHDMALGQSSMTQVREFHVVHALMVVSCLLKGYR